MQAKLRICHKCGKEKPIWKNISGKPHCKVCAAKVEVAKVKERKAKARAKKKATVTDRQLHTAFAKMIKQIYPLRCHACGVELILGSQHTQACHFVQRGRKVCTWDIRNVYPGCSTCNGFIQSHVYELGKKANMYWGEGTAEMLRDIEREDYKWSQGQKRELLALFTNPPQAGGQDKTREAILKKYLDIKNFG